MRTFSEADTVENLFVDNVVQIGWRYVYAPLLSRHTSEVFVETMLRDALVKLNPEIAAQPERADEVLY